MFKIANVPMVEFPQFKMFVPDVTIRILDTIKTPENPEFPNLEFSPNPFPDAKEYTFRFDDVPEFDEQRNPYPGCITDEQALKLYDILQYAVEEELKVLVHCVMGKCRSGGVTHAGIIIAGSYGREFQYFDNHALPNATVKSKIMRNLYL